MSNDFLIMRRHGEKLLPVTEWDREHLLDIPEGRDLTVKITRTRSPKQHRLFWSLLAKVVENHPYYTNPEQLLTWLKIRLGWVDAVMMHDGNIWSQTRSISFHSMGQDDFRKFFNQCVDVIVAEVIPETDKDALLDEVFSMLGMEPEEWTR
jgi:hypothetical protein